MLSKLPEEPVSFLQNSLSEKRYLHSVGVLETAFLLAESWPQHPVDHEALAWAALFHDCAKEVSKVIRLKHMDDCNFRWGKELCCHHKLIHGPMSADILRDEYGLDNEDALMAVAYHTTGHPDLKPIGWMVYIADYLEPGRTFYPQREEWLAEACRSPLTGLRLVTDSKIENLKAKGKPLHPLAEDFQRFLNNCETL